MLRKLSFVITLTAILTACHIKKKAIETPVVEEKSKQIATKTIEKVEEDTKTASAVKNDCGVEITYANLKPLIEKNCAGCHGQDNKYMNFKDYTTFLKFSKSGEIKKHVVEKRDMPPNEMLSQQDMQTIKCWLAGEMRVQ